MMGSMQITYGMLTAHKEGKRKLCDLIAGAQSNNGSPVLTLSLSSADDSEYKWTQKSPT